MRAPCAVTKERERASEGGREGGRGFRGMGCKRLGLKQRSTSHSMECVLAAMVADTDLSKLWMSTRRLPAGLARNLMKVVTAAGA